MMAALTAPWKRLKTASGAALRVRHLSATPEAALSAPSASTAEEEEKQPKETEKTIKYENIRKLLVGLGNPGEKYARTRHNIGSAALEHFLTSYANPVLDTTLTLEHEARNHGDVARFLLPFQQDVDDPRYRIRRDDLLSRLSKRRKERTLAEGAPHDPVNVALLLPTTYMNRSGTAVKTFMQHHQWRLKKNPMSVTNRQDELLVVADDVSLPFGTCRFKAKGGHGGQNGLRDVIKCVHTERFARLKIGVGAREWFAGGNTGAPAGTAMDKFVLGRFHPHEQDELPVLLDYVKELLRLFLHRGLTEATTVANSMDLAAYKKHYYRPHQPHHQSRRRGHKHNSE